MHLFERANTMKKYGLSRLLKSIAVMVRECMQANIIGFNLFLRVFNWETESTKVHIESERLYNAAVM